MKQSAGILAFRLKKQQLEVLLVHPGGPFYKNKDAGAWSIPKGEFSEGEEALAVAKREFEEETGNIINDSTFIKLTPVKIKSGKTITAFAVETNFDDCFISSNTFEIEWPPKSGKKQMFPEVDKADWFTMNEARLKISEGQISLLEQLQQLVGVGKSSLH